MRSKQRILISAILSAIFILGITSTQAGETDLISRLNLTKEQNSKLDPLVDEFITEALDIQSKLDNISKQIDQELKREDRFDTKSKARADMDIKDIKLGLEMDNNRLDLQDQIEAEVRDPQKANKIVMAIIDLGTKRLENRVNHILKAKDVLTVEQKKELRTISL